MLIDEGIPRGKFLLKYIEYFGKESLRKRIAGGIYCRIFLKICWRNLKKYGTNFSKILERFSKEIIGSIYEEAFGEVFKGVLFFFLKKSVEGFRENPQSDFRKKNP